VKRDRISDENYCDVPLLAWLHLISSLTFKATAVFTLSILVGTQFVGCFLILGSFLLELTFFLSAATVFSRRTPLFSFSAMSEANRERGWDDR